MIYILSGKEPVPCKDFQKWAIWMEENTEKKTIALNSIRDVTVSTVFLGIYIGESKHPLLFETMVFGGKMDKYQMRYSDYDMAIEGHHEICKKVIEEGI
jgi:hypothetical protein